MNEQKDKIDVNPRELVIDEAEKWLVTWMMRLAGSDPRAHQAFLSKMRRSPSYGGQFSAAAEALSTSSVLMETIAKELFTEEEIRYSNPDLPVALVGPQILGIHGTKKAYLALFIPDDFQSRLQQAAEMKIGSVVPASTICALETIGEIGKYWNVLTTPNSPYEVVRPHQFADMQNAGVDPFHVIRMQGVLRLPMSVPALEKLPFHFS